MPPWNTVVHGECDFFPHTKRYLVLFYGNFSTQRAIVASRSLEYAIVLLEEAFSCLFFKYHLLVLCRSYPSWKEVLYRLTIDSRACVKVPACRIRQKRRDTQCRSMFFAYSFFAALLETFQSPLRIDIRALFSSLSRL